MSSLPPNPAKQAARRQLRTRLTLLTPALRSEGSRQIRDRLACLPEWLAARRILGFAARPDEPDLQPLLLEALRSGKEVALPSFVASAGRYVARRLQPNPPPPLVPGPWGIPEPPPDAPTLEWNQLDLALVPGLGFTPDGRRLGRGKGFFDRMLADVRGFKCGVAFDLQVIDSLPLEPHDVVLDCILTPGGEWRIAPPWS